MKERHFQVNLLPKEQVEGIATQLGCDPNSIRSLRKPRGDRFFLTLEAEKEGIPKIIKLARDRRNTSRLQIESNVLSALPRDYLMQNGILLPEIEREFTQFGDLSAIMISKIPEGKRASLSDFCHVLDVFRQVEIPRNMEIERVKPEDYLKDFLTRLRFLQSIGVLAGLSQLETERLKQFYLENWQSLIPFDQVFVHGDFKGKHLRKVLKILTVIDFDKSVIGSELEDPAWLSIRHPDLSAAIKRHLRQQFEGQKEKSRNFDTAFRLMQIDRLVEAYFTRSYQWRGGLDYAYKTYGRVKVLLQTI